VIGFNAKHMFSVAKFQKLIERTVTISTLMALAGDCHQVFYQVEFLFCNTARFEMMYVGGLFSAATLARDEVADIIAKVFEVGFGV